MTKLHCAPGMRVRREPKHAEELLGAYGALLAAGTDLESRGVAGMIREETAREARALGAKAIVTIGDLTKHEDTNRVCDAALAGLSNIDILVNNWGVMLRDDNPGWDALPPQKWLDIYNLNFVSGIRMA